jgi:hypothetical protein
MLAHLGSRFSEGGNTVEAGIIDPDPDRETLGLEVRQPRSGEVSHLFLGYGER